MNPHLTAESLALFEKYLHRSENYAEVGSGGSTLYALQLPNIKHVWSVESDRAWYEKLKSQSVYKANQERITYLLADLKCKPNDWGNPSELTTLQDKENYSSALLQHPVEKFSCVLLDGRFRVACALKLHAHLSNECVVLLDDFVSRSFYNVVLKYFDVLEKSDSMIALAKKPNVTVPSEEIREYVQKQH